MLDVDRELDRQCSILLGEGVPVAAGRTEQEFLAGVRELRPGLRRRAAARSQGARVPFVLIASPGPDRGADAAEELVPRLRLAGGSRPGILDRNHGAQGLAPYRPIEQVTPPPAPVYALLDVDLGEEFRNVPPRDALPVLLGRGRTPLTIPEGIMLVLLHPQVLVKNACFTLAGSRRGDRRVPALWISERAPKLGWCWDGNPHSWLGLASTAARLGPDQS